MKGDENVEIFDGEEWDLILNKILTHYEGGKYKYDPEQSCQSQGHRNHKKLCKIAMKEGLKIKGKGYNKVAFNLLLDYCKQQDEPYYVKKLQEYLNQNDKLIKHNKQLQREKDNRDACLQSNVTLEFDKWKKDYICEREDVNQLNDKINNLKIQKSDRDDIIKELKQEVKDVRENCSKQLTQNAFQMAELELANQEKPNIKKLKEEMKELKDKHKDEIKQLKQKPKENMDCNKEKFLKDKLKKISLENLELKNRIVELEVEAM